MACAALAAAVAAARDEPLATGRVGAGAGATVGKWRGRGGAVPGGIGVAFTTIDDVLRAVEAVNRDYERHSRAAAEIAREYFSYDVVLPPLLV